MEINDFTLGLLGTIGTTLVGVIGKLYFDNKQLSSANDTIRDKYQEKFEGLLVKVIELTGNSAKQLESYNTSITTLTAAFATLRDDFLRGKGNQ